MPFVKRPNTHQTHFEDLVLLGPEGLNELNDKIEGVIDTIENNSGRLNLTTKIDGAPAVFCWHKYDGYPDDSISLKSFVSGPQNALSSIGQIQEKYGDRPIMSKILIYALELSKYIPDGECWQGDCLFTTDSKHEENILGTDYITFQPNKIIYAFSEENTGYEQIKNADFGICFHTIYRGPEKNQSFRVDPTVLDAPSNVYIMSPALGRSNDMKVYSLDKVNSLYDQLKSVEEELLSNDDYFNLISNSVFMSYWNTFENSQLADKKKVNLNEESFINSLSFYLQDKLAKEYNKKVGTLKTDAGREKARVKYESDLQSLLGIVETNKEPLTLLVRALNLAANIKMALWWGFKQSTFGYKTFYRSRTKGYFPADMEGIAMSDQDGNIVKIVDRSSFSSFNRDPDIMSGFEHPENISEEFEGFTEKYEPNLKPNNDHLWEKFNVLLEGNTDDYLVLSFSRMNPPTIGHLKLVRTMASLAGNNKARLYLSHTQDKKKNPLTYEQKIKWAKESFKEYEDKVELVESDLKLMVDVLHEVCEEGFKNIIYVCGEDRVDKARDLILTYDGQPDKKGNILFSFNDIKIINAGSRKDDAEYTYEYIKSHINELDKEEVASASLLRECAYKDDFDLFKEFVNLDETQAKKMFNEVRSGLGLSNIKLEEDVFNDNRSISANSIKDLYDGIVTQLMGTNISDRDNKKIKVILERIEELTNSLESISMLKSAKFVKKIMGNKGDPLILLTKMTHNDLVLLRGINEGNLVFDINSGNFLSELIQINKDVNYSSLPTKSLSQRFINYAFNLSGGGIGKGEMLLRLLGGEKPQSGDILFAKFPPEINPDTKQSKKIFYELKDMVAAAYNQDDMDFNSIVNRIFLILCPGRTQNEKPLQLKDDDIDIFIDRNPDFPNLTGREKILRILQSGGIDGSTVVGDTTISQLSFNTGKELFNALATMAANKACKRDYNGSNNSDSGKFLLVNSKDPFNFKIVLPNDLVKEVDISFWSAGVSGGSDGRCFKITGPTPTGISTWRKNLEDPVNRKKDYKEPNLPTWYKTQKNTTDISNNSNQLDNNPEL